MSANPLISEITRVFMHKPAPTGEQVLYDKAYAGDPELDEIREFFAGRLWTSLSPSDIFRFRHALSFFSPLALAYYAPAFMIAALRSERAVDTAVEDFVSTLGRCQPELWSDRESQTICRWLAVFAESLDEGVLQQAYKAVGCHRQ